MKAYCMSHNEPKEKPSMLYRGFPLGRIHGILIDQYYSSPL